MMIRAIGTSFVVVVVVACHSGTPPPPAPHFGDVMTQIGRRFELLGRAAVAKRWDLASFELGELREGFDDVPRAEIPDDVHADIPQLAKLFVPAIENALEAGLAKHDATEFARGFATASGSCNTCHHEAGRAYIEIPDKPGDSVPRLDPLP